MSHDTRIYDELTVSPQGHIACARQVASPFFDSRPQLNDINLLVIHSISLPPAQFGGPYIDQLFTGQLNPKEHEYFEMIHQFKVSAHCLIRRDGELVQYVPLNQRAWHAGVSEFEGRTRCNDFSIGIELEGTDNGPFEAVQYQVLAKLTKAIMKQYPDISLERITGHSDIAPGRKTDPGTGFDWPHFLALVKS